MQYLQVKNVIVLFDVIFLLIFDVARAVVTETFKEDRSDTMLTSVYSNVTVSSRTSCCYLCSIDSDCASCNYSPTANRCMLSKTEKVELNVKSEYQEGWSLYTRTSRRWLLVFRGQPGTGHQPYISFINGVGSTSDVTCQQATTTSCTEHYRNPILDEWSTLPITRVMVSFYKDGEQAAFIRFDGTGSTLENWFDQDRVRKSTWPDIKDEEIAVFKLHGQDRDFVVRPGGGCDGNSYTLTVWDEDHILCDTDIQPSYPQFLYSTTTSTGNPATMTGMARADSMVVYIQ